MFKRANMWGQKHGHSFTTFPFCHPSQLGSEGSKEGIWKRDCTRHKHMSVGSQSLEVCLVVHSPGLAKVHYRANLSNTVCLSRYLITCLKKAKGFLEKAGIQNRELSVTQSGLWKTGPSGWSSGNGLKAVFFSRLRVRNHPSGKRPP